MNRRPVTAQPLVEPMFSTLRAIAVIGTIYYLSPVHDLDDEPRSRDIARLNAQSKQAAHDEPASRLDPLWKLLPGPAKDAMLERMLTSALGPSIAKQPTLAPATDTLRREDLQPAWRGDGTKARP